MTGSDTADAPTAEATRWRSSERWAAIAFGVAIAAGLAVLLFDVGQNRWFLLDEWYFLAGRDGGDLNDLFRPHNEDHWSTLPILAYRVLWNIVGLRSYLPYLLLIVGLHLTVVVLLRIVMRRAGVSPWIATVSASMLILFGAGEQNILWAFQIGMVGSVVFGLTHLLLADHEGSIDRRDWFGLVAGLAGLMCSGVGVAMVFVVGLTSLVRRGWRVGLLHTAPLALAYLAWYLLAGPANALSGTSPRARTIVEFAQSGFSGTLQALGHIDGVGLALGFLLVIGLALAWLPPRSSILRSGAAPAAMLIGSVVFLGLTAWGRVGFFGVSFARQGRYLYIVAALLLPALAVAADEVSRRWRYTTPVVVLLLVVGMPGNYRLFGRDLPWVDSYFTHQRQLVLGMAHYEDIADVPSTAEPLQDLLETVTAGWLRDGAASGAIPEPGTLPAPVAAEVAIRLTITQTTEPRPEDCRPLGAPVDLQLTAGQAIGFSTPISVQLWSSEGTSLSTPVVFDPLYGRTLTVLHGTPMLRFSSNGSALATICTEAGP